ncbi:MAG: hypothetical protein ACLGIT_08925, partial [Gammaproteobacteria bacterium]
MPPWSPSTRRGGASRWGPGVLLALLLAVAAGWALWPDDDDAAAARSYEELTGSLFASPPQGPFRAPVVRELKLPTFADATSVWGATGRDFSGGVWVGVSTAPAGSSARLFQHDASTDTWHDRGSVVEQLAAAGLARSGQ